MSSFSRPTKLWVISGHDAQVIMCATGTGGPALGMRLTSSAFPVGNVRLQSP